MLNIPGQKLSMLGLDWCKAMEVWTYGTHVEVPASSVHWQVDHRIWEKTRMSPTSLTWATSCIQSQQVRQGSSSDLDWFCMRINIYVIKIYARSKWHVLHSLHNPTLISHPWHPDYSSLCSTSLPVSPLLELQTWFFCIHSPVIFPLVILHIILHFLILHREFLDHLISTQKLPTEQNLICALSLFSLFLEAIAQTSMHSRQTCSLQTTPVCYLYRRWYHTTYPHIPPNHPPLQHKSLSFQT
jgi:hypothetical protein